MAEKVKQLTKAKFISIWLGTIFPTICMLQLKLC